MKVETTKMGNSIYVLIPAQLAKEYEIGDRAEAEVIPTNEKLIIVFELKDEVKQKMRKLVEEQLKELRGE